MNQTSRTDVILDIGTLIEIHYTTPNNTVVKLMTLVEVPLKNDQLTICSPMQNGRVYPMEKDAYLQLLYGKTNEKTENLDFFEIDCLIIDKKNVDHLSYYVLHVLSQPKKVSRRGSFRLNVLIPATVKELTQEGIYDIDVINISVTGLKSISKKKIPIGSECVINLVINQEPLQIRAVLRGNDSNAINSNDHILRFEFLNNQTILIQKISTFIMSKQAEQIQKLRETNENEELFDFTLLKKEYSTMNKIIRYVFFIFNIIMILLLLPIFAELEIATPSKQWLVFETLMNIKPKLTTWDVYHLSLANKYVLLAIGFSLFSLIFKTVVKSKHRLKIDVFSMSILSFVCLIWAFIHFQT